VKITVEIPDALFAETKSTRPPGFDIPPSDRSIASPYRGTGTPWQETVPLAQTHIQRKGPANRRLAADSRPRM